MIANKEYLTTLNVDDIISMKDENDNKYYYLHDGLGSMCMLTDKKGDVVQKYDYDAFGKPNVTTEDKNTYKFTSREYDSDSGLYYNRARYYDLETGRFIQKDPLIIGDMEQSQAISTPIGSCMSYSFMPGLPTRYFSAKSINNPIILNNYVYCENNPIKNKDLFGLYELEFTGIWLKEVGEIGNKQWEAQSGNRDKHSQYIPNVGPIPEGRWRLSTLVQPLSEASAYDWGYYRLPIFGSKRVRVPITFYSEYRAQTYKEGEYIPRGSFYIHGGDPHHTQGCIKLSNNDMEEFVRIYRNKCGTSSSLNVKYPEEDN